MHHWSTSRTQPRPDAGREWVAGRECPGRFVSASVAAPKRPTTVLLVDQRPAFRLALADEIRSAGMEVARAESMADLLKEAAHRRVDLLLLNVDRIDEPSWLRAAQYRRTHPDVRVWAYTSWSSPVDVTLAGFVPVDELIYHDGSPCDLADKIAAEIASRDDPPAIVAGFGRGSETSAAA